MSSLIENIPLVQTTSKGRYFDKIKRAYVPFETAGQRILTVGEITRLRRGGLWTTTVMNRPAALRLLRGSHAVGILYDGAYAEADKVEERSLSLEGFAARTERLKAIITTLNGQFADFNKSRAIATEHNMDLTDVSNVIRELSLGEHLSVDQLSWLTSQEAGPLRTMLVMTLPDEKIVEKVKAPALDLPPAVEEAAALMPALDLPPAVEEEKPVLAAQNLPDMGVLSHLILADDSSWGDDDDDDRKISALAPAVEESTLPISSGQPAFTDEELKQMPDALTFKASMHARRICKLAFDGEDFDEFIYTPPGLESSLWVRLLSTYFNKHADKMV